MTISGLSHCAQCISESHFSKFENSTSIFDFLVPFFYPNVPLQADAPSPSMLPTSLLECVECSENISYKSFKTCDLRVQNSYMHVIMHRNFDGVNQS